MPAFAQDDAPAANTNAASADDGISELPEAMQAQAKQMLAMMKLDQQKDPAKLKMAMSALEAQMANVPEEAKPLMEFVQKKIQARIDELEASGAETKSDAKADAAPAAGSSDAAPAAEPAPVAVPAEAQQAMDAFIHSVLIGRADLAKSAAEVLLNTNVTPSQAAQIVDAGGFAERFQRALESSRAMPEVSTLATELGKKVDAGRLDLARDPARIDAAVTNLNGTLRQQTFAMRSLEAAGAYAMPALIRAFTAGASSSQELMAERAILNIGRNAVLPLCESLNGLPAGQQVRVIRVLGELGSKIAAPWIASVANAKGATSDLRQAASEAMSRMGVSSTDQNALWTSMARSFIVGAEGLLPYPAEMQQPTWRFDGDHGLMPKMVSTGVYCDIMAQRCATATPATARRWPCTWPLVCDLRRRRPRPRSLRRCRPRRWCRPPAPWLAVRCWVLALRSVMPVFSCRPSARCRRPADRPRWCRAASRTRSSRAWTAPTVACAWRLRWPLPARCRRPVSPAPTRWCPRSQPRCARADIWPRAWWPCRPRTARRSRAGCARRAST
ncbi:MAG: hypothetical protein EBR71_05515 [Planctomycetes bacterium]|nr:hypothetical protein [Planctomycetota bacterium]